MADNINNEQNKPLTDEAQEPIQDGAIPIQATQNNVEGLQANSLGIDPITISFENGNYNNMITLPNQIAERIKLLRQTFIPLIEVALIELLGTSQLYRRYKGDIFPSFDVNKINIDFDFEYFCSSYIGTDFEYEDLMHDSKYILDRISPAGANITKCEIDSSNGIITIRGSM